jgi:hypothetical protein
MRVEHPRKMRWLHHHHPLDLPEQAQKGHRVDPGKAVDPKKILSDLST